MSKTFTISLLKHDRAQCLFCRTILVVRVFVLYQWWRAFIIARSQQPRSLCTRECDMKDSF